MTRKSKRALARDLEDLKPKGETKSVAAIELESGEYVTPDGEPVTESTDVIFGIPYSVWSQWERIPEGWDIDPQE